MNARPVVYGPKRSTISGPSVPGVVTSWRICRFCAVYVIKTRREVTGHIRGRVAWLDRLAKTRREVTGHIRGRVAWLDRLDEVDNDSQD